MAAVLNRVTFAEFGDLAGTLFVHMCQNAATGETIRQVYASNPIRVETTTCDITETARRYVEPGGPAATLLFSRGVQAIMVYTSRVT